MAGPMVRRLLDGSKTQTRRVGARWLKVKPGDVLYVREAFSRNEGNLFGGGVLYRADNVVFSNFDGWTPAVHMPLHLVRMHLVVKRVWFERADAIEEADAVAEGMLGVTVEDLLEMAGGSKRKVVQALYPASFQLLTPAVAEVWPRLVGNWHLFEAKRRFSLVLAILGATPDTTVTAIEFKVVRV